MLTVEQMDKAFANAHEAMAGGTIREVNLAGAVLELLDRNVKLAAALSECVWADTEAEYAFGFMTDESRDRIRAAIDRASKVLKGES